MKILYKLLIFALIVALVAQNTTAGQTPFTLELSQNTAEIGDIVKINSQIPGQNSYCVYLFMTGPDFPDEGVPIEGDIRHSKIPYDKIFLSGPIFEHSWDTGLIIGGLNEGEYTIYLSTKEQDAINPEEGTYATAKISILDSNNSKKQSSPLPVFLIGVSLLIAAGIQITKKNNMA